MKKALMIAAILVIGIAWYTRQNSDLPEPVAYSDVIASEAPAERSNLNSALDAAPATSDNQRDDRPAPSISEGIASPPAEARNDNTGVPSSVAAIPSEYNLAVPFQPQAPHADWSLPYQEACEEASLIMADRFFSGESLSLEQMDAAIKDVVAWEQDVFGYYEDTTAGEVARIASDYFNLNAILDFDVRPENIKRHISQNKLVVVPAAGRELPNPYFTGDGPLYHMLVIRGYTQTQFITNDPGTRRGEQFLYAYDDLINAIHDWPREHGGFKDGVSEEEMRNGTPVLIVLDRGAGS